MIHLLILIALALIGAASGAFSAACFLAFIDSRRWARNLERAAQRERESVIAEAERIVGGVA